MPSASCHLRLVASAGPEGTSWKDAAGPVWRAGRSTEDRHMSRTRRHLRLVPGRGAARTSVCRRFGCAADALELGLCKPCFAGYRAQVARDERALLALSAKLEVAAAPKLRAWPELLRPLLAHNLAAQLLWELRPAGGLDVWTAAEIATLSDALDICLSAP
jgi:hypothetical protein